MRIVVGVDNREEMTELIRAGANEFFVGVMMGKRQVNHRPAIGTFQFADVATLREALALARDHGKPVMLTINEPAYNEPVFPDVLRLIDSCAEAGIDGVISASLGVTAHVKSRWPSLKRVLSVVNPCLNSSAARFFHEFGVDRIVFPRHLMPPEVRRIVGDVPVEAEVFFNGVGFCRFIDGHCSIHSHKPFASTCGLFHSAHSPGASFEPDDLNEPRFPDIFDTLYDYLRFERRPLLKLATRGLPSARKVEYCARLTRVIGEFDRSPPDRESFRAMGHRIMEGMV